MKRIETAIHIDARPEEVWSVLVDFARHHEWNPFFARIEGRAEVGTRLAVVSRKGDGEGISFKPTVLRADPGQLLQWKGSLVVPGVFDGTHSFELRPTDGGTTLVHSEEFGGLLVPLLGRLLRQTEEGFEAFNRALADRVVEVRDGGRGGT